MKNKDNFAILAERLKQVRTNKKMTQKEFAQKMGFTPVTLSAYENNSKKPSLDLMLEVAKKCDISLDWLCGLSDTKSEKYSQENITYADILKTFIKIEDNSIGFDIKTVKTDMEKKVFFNEYNVAIFLKDKKLEDYLIKWNKFNQLKNDEVIDNDIYTSCIEKLLRDSNVIVDFF